ncbi:hypothetical protein LDENG_00038360 [Lucifuga dentata]|nr:hypothetical protein LDENG_00038360 [Lucifuga dentata]
MAAIKALEQWCKTECEGYRDVAITNMTTSFRSGMAFCALIHKYRPDLIEYESLRKEDVFENNKLAFQVAEEKLGIPALLDAEDMVALRIPDRLSILTYVSQYYNYFHGRPPLGGVKRPAEGSKEEPSEKKNLPVVAKTFVSKTAIKNRLPPSLITQTSPKLSKAAAQKTVLAENSSKNENSNKNGTLSSKCVVCKSHVHLVQRHFVEGKLYHRSCFKCSECSSLLYLGSYKPGKELDTFICKSCKPPSSEAKNGPTSSAGWPNGASQTQLAPHPSSVLSAPLSVILKPVSPGPPAQSWTASAQKTQTARQRFFQATPPVTEASTDIRKPTEPSYVSGWPKIPGSPDDKRKAKAAIGKKLGEQNCNNNNRHPFIIRSAERRFGEEPNSADSHSFTNNKCSQGSAGNWAGQPSTSHTNNKESLHLKAINDSTRPTTVYTHAKDPLSPEWQTKFKPVETKPGPRTTEAVNTQAFTEQQKPGSMSTTSSRVSVSTERSLSTHTPAVSPLSFPLFDPAHVREVSPQKPQPVSGNTSVKRHSYSSMKSPPRSPAVESISSSTTPANHGTPLSDCSSGAKKGKYLSPTSASRTEMRSPSFIPIKSYHIPLDQIERELNDIEASLAYLEKEGVELEKKLRSCEEEGEGDILMDPLMVDWFNLIQKKQMYIRKESELVYIARTQELERQQPGVEWELRRLLEKPEHLKSTEEQQLEKKLMQKLVEIVDGRNAIVEGLDEDRLREVEEDQELNQMMQNLGVKKAKNKRKSSISKLFRRRSKRRVE